MTKRLQFVVPAAFRKKDELIWLTDNSDGPLDSNIFGTFIWQRPTSTTALPRLWYCAALSIAAEAPAWELAVGPRAPLVAVAVAVGRSALGRLAHLHSPLHSNYSRMAGCLVEGYGNTRTFVYIKSITFTKTRGWSRDGRVKARVDIRAGLLEAIFESIATWS